MEATNFLGKDVTIMIERPLGSIHPKHPDIYYPVNYGYLPHSVGRDQEELDAYLLGVFIPLDTFTGRCIAVIHRTNDQDDKLVIVPPEKNYTDEQIQALTEFQERFFTSIILREGCI